MGGEPGLDLGPARRVVWVVLDGAAHWVTERLIAAGAMPTLARMRDEGVLAPAIPEAPNAETPAQLATLYTGAPTRDHGILGFHLPLETDPFERESGFTPERLRAQPVWRAALRAGRTVALAHIAFADPGALEGESECCVLLADGYNRSDGRTFVRPHAARAAFLERTGPFQGNGDVRAYLDGELGPAFPDGEAGDAEARFLQSLEACADHFERTALHVLDDFPADLTLLYYPCVDEAAHAWMLLVEDAAREAEPRRQAAAWELFRRVHARADRYVAAVASRLGEDDALIVCSDHGLNGIHTRVHVNRVLARVGLARFDAHDRLVPARTRVFLPPANHGYLRVHGGGEADVEEARAALESLVDAATGKPVFEAFLSPGSVFSAETGCLFLVAAPGYEVTAANGPAELGPAVMKGHHQSGTHRPELRGIFLARGPGPVAGSALEPLPNRAIRTVVEDALAR